MTPPPRPGHELDPIPAPPDYGLTYEFVHPRVYKQRAECPLWTNEPSPTHVHNRDCKL